MLKLDEEYEVRELEKLVDTDVTKYKFTWTQDICWDNNDLGKDAGLLDQYRDSGDTDKFIEVFNKHYEDNAFKLQSINTLHGPGAGWPEADIITSKYITIKELIKSEHVDDVESVFVDSIEA